jgi:hypothetical protein
VCGRWEWCEEFGVDELVESGVSQAACEGVWFNEEPMLRGELCVVVEEWDGRTKGRGGGKHESLVRECGDAQTGGDVAVKEFLVSGGSAEELEGMIAIFIVGEAGDGSFDAKDSDVPV